MISDLLKKGLRVILRNIFRPFLSEVTYLKLRYLIEMGKKLPLDNPVTMNEKLQWLKLNNRYKELTDLVDKIKVKDIIAAKIGSKYIIPTIEVWNSSREINLTSLPKQFVIKTNHSGGSLGVFICTDKYKVNIKDIRKKMSKSLKEDIYYNFIEWPYKNVDRKIFAERYMGENLIDYKFYCFNGEVDSVLVCLDRALGKPKFYFFDREWNLRRYNKRGKEAPIDFTIPKPIGMNEMFDIAAKLSEGIPFVRVDLYNVNGKIYFGELTFYPDSGMDSNRLVEADTYFGNKINLSLSKIDC